MEIVAIEKRVFERMMQCFKDLAKLVEILNADNRDKDNWLDSGDVCRLLKISRRTLQSYRDTGVLPYSQVGRRCYCKLTDIEQIISRVKIEDIKSNNYLSGFDVLTGNWESVNLNPTVIIYCNESNYLLSIIHVNETSGQACPATYEIREDEKGYFFNDNMKRVAISYDRLSDMLNLSTLGDYIRN